jgi:NitT/TauT family transport system substrate-binding protein
VKRVEETVMPAKISRRSLILSAAAASSAPNVWAQNARDSITFLTDYGYYGRHSYIFYALKKGYFADEGVDVTILRGQGSYDVAKQIANGVAQFGIVDTAAIILGRGNDGIPIKAVAMIYAKLPSATFVMKGAGISQPKDLEGRTIAGATAGSGRALFGVYARLAGFDASKVKWVNAPSDSLPAALIGGRVDGINNFVLSMPLLSKMAAPKAVLPLPFSEVGMDGYAQALTTSESVISAKPDLVKRVARATLRGLKEAIANPAEAGAIVNQYHREVDADIAAGETEILRSLATLPGVELGSIQPDRMAKTIELVKETSALSHPVKSEDVFIRL